MAGRRRVHVGKIKCRDQHQAEQARSAQHVQLCVCARLSFCFEFSLGRLRRQARCARRMYVGKIKNRDQHRAEDQASMSDRGGGSEHMTDMLRRGA